MGPFSMCTCLETGLTHLQKFFLPLFLSPSLPLSSDNFTIELKVQLAVTFNYASTYFTKLGLSLDCCLISAVLPLY